MDIVLSGASGFIGRHLLDDLRRRGHRVRPLYRARGHAAADSDAVVIENLAARDALKRALDGADAVIHAAGLATVSPKISEADYQRANVEGTASVVEAARQCGVRRIVNFSSIRAVCGSTSDRVVDDATPPAPVDAYGRSKREAEQLVAASGLDWVSLRPVPVYGAGASGGLAALLKLARLPTPLPLKQMRNRRSLLAIENLTEAVQTVLAADGELRRAMLVADAEALSLQDMIATMRQALGRNPALFSLPSWPLEMALRKAARTEAADRLFGELVVATPRLVGLGWRPVISAPAAISAFAKGTQS